ncbi:MAG: hypothetical protein KF715_03605 [Candidatus Didemnitutus sp.]|nr:hypothetical protein [Candidatus Didemnitutus sp.]
MSAPRNPIHRWHRRWEELSYGQQRRLQTLAILALLALCAPVLYVAARPHVNHWRHRQALAQAERFEQQQDYRSAVLALHRATQIAPDDVETWRRVARTLDALGASDALVAHENIVALAPDDAQARAALAAAALRFGSAETTRRALEELARDPAQRESYLRLSAELARELDDLPAYEAHLIELSRLQPDDADIRFNLAALQVVKPSPADQSAGRDALLALLENSRVRVRAALELLRVAARRRDPAFAGTVVNAINARAGSNLAAPAVDPWPALLATLQRAALAGGEADISRVAQWMASVRRTDEALAWLAQLPGELLAAPAVREIAADLAARANDASRARGLLVAGAWGPWPAESIDAALAAHAEQLAEHPGAARTRWQEAVRYAEQSPVALRNLARLARLWQDDESVEIAAKAALARQPRSPWANRELRDIYFTRGDTAKLLAHYHTWLAVEPDRPAVLFGCVRAAVALGRVDTALEQRVAAPANAAPATPLVQLAHALILARTQPETAQRIIAALPPAARDLPEAILVRALAGGDTTAVQIMTQKPQELFPEERSLLKLLGKQVDK